jgi:hypothetical protein
LTWQGVVGAVVRLPGDQVRVDRAAAGRASSLESMTGTGPSLADGTTVVPPENVTWVGALP